MTVEDSLNQSMDRAVEHYSSLFRLPSYKKVILLLALSCISGGILSTIILFPTFEGLVNGLFLGFSLFLVNLIFDNIIEQLILKQDPIYDLRRTTALSLFCWALWLLFIFVGVTFVLLFDLSWLIRLCLLGFSVVLIFRLVVFNSTSSIDYKQLLAASILQPFSCVIPFLILWSKIGYSFNLNMFLFFVFSPVTSLLSGFLFLTLLNHVGQQTLGIPSLSLFKAFLVNWIVGLNTPLEEFLEKLGEEQDVEISMIKFDTSKPKAIIVVPSLHPGPFKNVGSSLLPSMLKTALEKELNCVACVPHGLLGHELDLASQMQSQKIIKHVVDSANFKASEAKATRFTEVSNGLSTACCQVFGKSAFVSFTLAPRTTEDLPKELGIFVDEEAEKHGLTECIVVNAHNSINGRIDMREALNTLKAAAANCLKQSASQKRLPFEVGASAVIPKEFKLKDGMGPGGITAIVVKVGRQKTAYIVIDGNNMISGLREKIILTLQSIGINKCEVFTTDTHSVNAVILSERGYHPVGEAIDHERLIGYIKKVTLVAMSNLERVRATTYNITVPDVKVIGAKKLEVLCLLTDRTIRKAKEIFIPIFASSAILSMLLLAFV